MHIVVEMMCLKYKAPGCQITSLASEIIINRAEEKNLDERILRVQHSEIIILKVEKERLSKLDSCKFYKDKHYLLD